MTVSGISSNLFTTSSQTIQAKIKQFQQEFQLLGSDLQSGKVSAAQSDFVTLQQLGAQSQSGSASAAQSSNPIAQAFAQLGKDLQSGNVSGAQQDFSTLQQAFQNQAAQTPAAQTGSPTRGHHHHHHGGGESSNSSSSSTAVSQLFAQLGTELQAGNLTSAQTTYNTLLQDFPQAGASTAQATAQTSAVSSAGGLSLTA
jgi:outer membrane protein assembly factor BamD (BamD/ComL family)